MKITGALWVWVQSYGAKVLRGEQSGGQRDIRLGKDLRHRLPDFFRGTRASRGRGRFEFEVEPYAGVSSWKFTIRVNTRNVARANEVRLIRQDARSAEAYPLWRYSIKRIKDGAAPRQAVLFVKDMKGRVHVRLVDRALLSQLPRGLSEELKRSVKATGAPSGFWQSDRERATIKAELASVRPPTKEAKSLPWISGPRPSAKELKRRGLLGENHVIELLRRIYPEPKFRVLHVALDDPCSPYDVRVTLARNSRTRLFVEVKATVGQAKDPIQISERELAFRRKNRSRHRIYLVYLGRGGTLPPRDCIELISDNQFRLAPRDFFLWPKVDT